MFRCTRCLFVFACLCLMHSVSDADDKVIVYRANSPVVRLAKVFGDLGESTAFRAVETSNTLIISADEDSIDKILGVLEQIDPKPQSIRIHAYVLALGDGEEKTEAITGSIDEVNDKIESLSKSNQIESVSKVQLTTLNQQAAFVQIGERKPIATSTMTRNGKETTQYNSVDVGSVFGITPRLGDQICQLEIDFERSLIRPSSDGAPSGTSEMKVNSTVSVPLGSFVEVQRTSDGEYQTHSVLMIGVEVVE